MGKICGEKVVSKLYLAKAQLPAIEITKPVPAAKEPKKKYSIDVIASICIRLAPMVRSSTLSRMRWYLLMRTDAMSTITPVRMLKSAIN